MTIQPPAPGWLDHRFHEDFRELLLHACARERLLCPVYCLMPDHVHLMWLGLSLQSDQVNGMKFLRVFLNRMLRGECLVRKHLPVDLRPQLRGAWKLQSQAFDHVLQEEERKRDAFASVCFYIMANPVRAGLVRREQEWPYSGAVVPGYPDSYPFQEDFWELFWKIYYKHREPAPSEPVKS